MTTSTLTWTDVLAEEKAKPYFTEILDFLKTQYQKGKTIYPPKSDLFNALKYTPFDDVKVVIIGQDPYHGPKQAHGLCFSVQPGIKPPPSLVNIYKELQNDIDFSIPNHGCLIDWTKQGVLLLNASLSVEAAKPQSHAKIGWQQFTDAIIKALNQHPKPIVYLLWGSYAQSKRQLIDTNKHQILTAPHPSPLSAHRGFLGCKHFSKANALLEKLGRTPIDWALPETAIL